MVSFVLLPHSLKIAGSQQYDPVCVKKILKYVQYILVRRIAYSCDCVFLVCDRLVTDVFC